MSNWIYGVKHIGTVIVLAAAKGLSSTMKIRMWLGWVVMWWLAGRRNAFRRNCNASVFWG